jgi:transcriptional regulator with XRE-family HTH domain
MPRRVYPNLATYLRENDDESLRALARELDISPAYLSMIKWGERQPALDIAMRIARRCGIPLESLVRRRTAKAS